MKNHFRQVLTFVLSFLLFTGTIQLQAQVEAFRLPDYIAPSYSYRQLETGFNLNTSLSQLNSNYPDDYSTKSKAYHGSLYGVYSASKNLARYQEDLSAGLSLNSLMNSSYSKIYNSQTIVNSSHGFTLWNNSSHRFYFPKKWFVEAAPELLFSYSEIGEKTNSTVLPNPETSFQDKQNTSACQLGSVLALGHGRIEDVRDAQMAAYILRDLGRLNLARQGIGENEVAELARLITRLKNTRFFDYRARKIREITLIDSLLSTRGIRNNPGAAYFTSLNDQWLYSNNPERLNGYRVYAGVKPGFGLDHVTFIQDSITPDGFYEKSREKTHSTIFSGFIGLKYEKPLSLGWQQSISAEAGMGQASNRKTSQKLVPGDYPEEMIFKFFQDNYYAEASYKAGFYPNTRTWVTGEFQTSYFLWDVDREWNSDFIKDNTEQSLDIILSVQAYYYISEQLRLVPYFSATYNVLNKNSGTLADPSFIPYTVEEKKWDIVFNCRLMYSLF